MSDTIDESLTVKHGMKTLTYVAFCVFCVIHVLIIGAWGLITVAGVTAICFGLPRLLNANRRYWGGNEDEIIATYNDSKICGEWGVFDPDTNTSKIMGNMVSRTIKIRHPDGSVGLDHEWITEDDAKNDGWRTK